MDFDDALKRFWNKVEKTETCWNWKAASSQGYGRFVPSNHHAVQAHRFSYELVKGKIPKGLELDHLCRNRLCVNPDHLEPVKRRENLIRSPIFNGTKTHCKRGHELSGSNLIQWYYKKYGYRWCRICHNEKRNKTKTNHLLK